MSCPLNCKQGFVSAFFEDSSQGKSRTIGTEMNFGKIISGRQAGKLKIGIKLRFIILIQVQIEAQVILPQLEIGKAVYIRILIDSPAVAT